MKKLLIIMILMLTLLSCGNENIEQENINNINKPETVDNTKVIEKINESEIIDNMFTSYCNLSKIIGLYKIAPSTEYYKSFIGNDGDISSQKVISSILLAERTIINQDMLISELLSNSGSYKNTVNLLIKSDEHISIFLKNMNKIVTFDDFKNNTSDFLQGIELLGRVPDEFSNEYINPGSDVGSLLKLGELGCNANYNISYWENRIQN